jgi:hypothetical protein
MLFVTLAKMRGAMDEEFGKKSEQRLHAPFSQLKKSFKE